MSKTATKILVIVGGDTTIDWNIARVRRTDMVAREWNAEDLTRAFCQPGGAVMLSELIKSVAHELETVRGVGYKIDGVSVPKGRVTPDDKRFAHSYVVWAPFKLDETAEDTERQVWRVSEFLGLFPPQHASVSPKRGRKLGPRRPRPRLIVLDDADLGFRNNEDCWPAALKGAAGTPWILVKMARPVAKGRLWDYLHRKHRQRLAIVMTANDLRRSQVHISRQASWERTAQDLVWELSHNPEVNKLKQAAHVLVSFGTEGAIWLSRRSRSRVVSFLVFDPHAMEGEWGRNHKGYMVGYNTCLTAAVAKEIMLNPSKPDMLRGIQSGIAAARYLHIRGYGDASKDPGKVALEFPAGTVAKIIADELTDPPLSVAQIRRPARLRSPKPRRRGAKAHTESDYWTLLGGQEPDSLEEIAERIVCEGLQRALPDVPIARFGKLITVDRSEIEALHGISNVMLEYSYRYRKEPLSIAVFGQPGSGKSFAVEQVVQSILPERIEWLGFNLSQFTGPADLLGAFHQVRDKALIGKIPVVFWDEFDANLGGQPLGWLRYFLAPMQDGEFLDGQITHPIGQSVFVFAGGTSHSMEEFRNPASPVPREAKLTDFISRLRGFLNVMGPNRVKAQGASGAPGDPYYIIRRAVILRIMLENAAPQLFVKRGQESSICIDPGLLRAFLQVKEYKHGARSIKAIITMSRIAGKTIFERSSLPPQKQLSLHVDGNEFFDLCSTVR
jgi:hypothetical protein